MRYSPENSKEDFSDEYCLSEIRRTFDLANLEVNLRNKSFWTMAAQVAKSYRSGRVLLVGDAAHRLPPTGGLGMNTGVQDAHNLAWKLAFVLNYQCSDKLLDSYYEERSPVAKRNIQWSSENAKRYVDIGAAIRTGEMDKLTAKLEEQQKNLNYEGLDLGFVYHSKNIASENDDDISVRPGKYIPTTLPGSRAPYVMLEKDGISISTLDLFEREYVLLVGEKAYRWEEAGHELSKKMHIPLKCYRVANDGDLIDKENNWLNAYEISSAGAVLVRPDGHVAWRCKDAVSNSKALLERYFNFL